MSDDAGDDPTDDRTSVADARDRLLALADPIDRTDTVPLSVASERVLASEVEAREASPVDGVETGERLFPAGHRLRGTDVGLLKVAGIDDVSAVQRPTVGIVPTGDDLVQREASAAAGERVETTAFTLAQHVDRWGGKVTYRDVVREDRHALRAAVQRDLTRDAVVVTGVDADGLVREVVAELGEIHVEGLAIDPGGTAAVASVEDRPVLLLPDSPVDCLVAAVQLLRPLVAELAGAPLPAHPHHHASMESGVESEHGVRTFVPVALSDYVATPLGDGDPTLRDVTRADGWVSVEDESGGLDSGESVGVIDWEQA